MTEYNANSTQNAWAGLENRRAGVDRRSQFSHPFSLKSLRGQRHRGRRKEDALGIYVDRYEHKHRVLCLGIILLSCLDAFFTLRILELGGEEVNPVMKYLLEWDIWGFIYIKLVVTALCIMILVTHIHFKWFRLIKVSYFLYASFAIYVSLIGYELHLLNLAYSHHFP